MLHLPLTSCSLGLSFPTWVRKPLEMKQLRVLRVSPCREGLQWLQREPDRAAHLWRRERDSSATALGLDAVSWQPLLAQRVPLGFGAGFLRQGVLVEEG